MSNQLQLQQHYCLILKDKLTGEPTFLFDVNRLPICGTTEEEENPHIYYIMNRLTEMYYYCQVTETPKYNLALRMSTIKESGGMRKRIAIQTIQTINKIFKMNVGKIEVFNTTKKFRMFFDLLKDFIPKPIRTMTQLYEDEFDESRFEDLYVVYPNEQYLNMNTIK
jgi:hypothetical protein